MDLTIILDPLSALIVVGGTLLAVLLRCGWAGTRAMAVAVAQLAGRKFDSEKMRADLAAQIREIDAEGLLRAEPHRFGDGEFDDLADALIHRRSIQALYDEHERHRQRRQAHTGAAVAALNSMAELAPVLGLVGTLLSLSTLSVGGVSNADYAQAIGTAVITTLYGLLLANFVASPLSAMVQRRAEAEEAERQRLLDWLAENVSRATPRMPGAPAEAVRGAA